METFQKYKWRAASLLIVFSTIGLGMGVIRPAIHQTVQMNSERKVLFERVAAALDWEDRLLQIEQEQAAIDAFFTDVRVEMPGEYVMSTLIERFFSIAEASNVTIRRLEPLDREETETYIRVPFQIRFSGSYHNMIKMLNELEKLGYWLNPEAITLRAEQTERSRSIEATVQIGIVQLKTGDGGKDDGS